ncbi:MAG: glycosylphosphatidylinositol anchor biosynthesis [Trizodia sp. TS-e1964]|nr:MAG: glycosylphosphatidylinositol anchor biosynthesis [Trizodia sp. TS-e1964]
MQSLAVFYGTNDWHYYLSQGLPLLLTTALPFAVMGVWSSLRLRSAGSAVPARFSMAGMLIFVIFALSCISHKEVRFIYPLLPVLHVLAAKPVSDTFFQQKSSSSNSSPSFMWLLVLLGIANASLAAYSSLFHQSGVIDVTDHLRHTYEQTFLHSPRPVDMTVGFLMPCHSTPWRSHLIYASIKAWALGCEPPVHLNSSERLNYTDEADRFYSSPEGFLETDITHGKGWPEYLIFFEERESMLQGILNDSYREDWRVFNSHVHDDWRRKGDIIVWHRRNFP